MTITAENMTPGLFAHDEVQVRVSADDANNDPRNWKIGKRRGNRVRFRNVITAAWDGWTKLTPADPEYRVPMQELAIEDLADSDDFSETDAAVQKRIDDSIGYSEETVIDVPPAYNAMNRDTLRKLAAEHNVKGRGTMTKDQLVAALESLDDLS